LGVIVAFEHSGEPCGSAASPCRIASVSTDVLPSTTDLTIGQAECALVFDARVGPSPASDSDDRRAGLPRYTVPVALCFAGTRVNFTASASVDLVNGALGMLCQQGTVCSTQYTLTTEAIQAVGGGLPWNPADSVAFGDAVSGGRPLSVARIVTAAIVFPDASGSVLPPPSAPYGPATCMAPAADITPAERALTLEAIAALQDLGATGTDGIAACNGAMASIAARAPVGWEADLLESLSAAETWAAGAIPHSAQDALRYQPAESGYLIASAVGFGTLVALCIGALAAACHFAFQGRKRPHHTH
jgi:hypothetical protein